MGSTTRAIAPCGQLELEVMKAMQSVGFIGAGRMATALARGLIASQSIAASDVFGFDVSDAACQQFVEQTGGAAASSVKELCGTAETVVLAVKPQHVGAVLDEAAPHLSSRHLVVSVAAGVKLETLAEAIGERRLIRVMPNTPCLIGAGASAFARGSHATDSDAEQVREFLETVGIAFEVQESLLDAVTGLSGSGPAYGYLMIEALSDGGVRAGLPRHIATQLAAQTMLGAARMVLETGEHPGALKDAVASPGGTTIAGLHALESGGLRGTLMDAVIAAANRSAELGG